MKNRLRGSADHLVKRPQGRRLIASASASLEAAVAQARAADINAVVLSDAIEGEAYEVAAIAREVATKNRPLARPVVILSGGETTVTVRGDGRGRSRA